MMHDDICRAAAAEEAAGVQIIASATQEAGAAADAAAAVHQWSKLVHGRCLIGLAPAALERGLLTYQVHQLP
jgi:hypothetical protein